MEIKETNIEEVREYTKLLFDCYDISKCVNEEFGNIIISHPFSNSGFVGGQDENGKLKMLNVVENEDDYKQWRDRVFHGIDKFTIKQIMFRLINNPYYLTWLSMIKDSLSLKDFSELFGEIWVSQENPNGDINVPIQESITWFKEADKKYLMNKHDYKIYSDLPDKIELYRGVSPGRNLYGLSYTREYGKARWFQDRFTTDADKGYLIKIIANKEDVLAYFNTRGEEEIVLDTSLYLDEIYKQVC